MSRSTEHTQEDVARTLGVTHSAVRKSKLRRGLLVGAAVVVVIGVGLVLRAGSRKETVRYVTQPATRGKLVVTVSATGTLNPINKVDVGIEVSGTIKTLDVDYNDHVRVGQVLAELDTTLFEAKVQQAKAALDSAKAKVLQAQATVQESEAKWAQLNRVRELSGGKMPAQTDLDAAQATRARAKADEASAQALEDQAQAALDADQTDLSKAVIHSPIDGVVLTRNVEKGQTVAASFEAPTLFTLAEDLKQMELLVDVDEADVGSVREGQDAVFTVDAYPDRDFPARITQVRYGSETVEGVVTYKAVLRVDNSDLLLRPGMTATAVITVNKIENALLVPNAALRFVPPDESKEAKQAGGSIVNSLLPHPPHDESKANEQANAKGKQQNVWTLRDGRPTALAITKGTSDGVKTEVTAGALEPGVELITDTETVKP